MTRITFIGGGNMASSLIGGLVADGFDPKHIAVFDINNEKLSRLEQMFNVMTYTDAADAVTGADIVTVCVKPQNFKHAAQTLAPLLKQHNSLIVSIAAGIRTANINQWLQGKYAIVRAMPNTPALVQCGAAALFANEYVSNGQRDEAESLLRATGIVEWVEDEALMDVVTALSGSGPAYFFRIMEGLIEGAHALGLSRQTAHLLTLQTALGAAKMAIESDTGIVQLRENVTSRGGTTERGLAVLDDNHIDKLLQQVLAAAHQRAVELADQLGES